MGFSKKHTNFHLPFFGIFIPHFKHFHFGLSFLTAVRQSNQTILSLQNHMHVSKLDFVHFGGLPFFIVTFFLKLTRNSIAIRTRYRLILNKKLQIRAKDRIRSIAVPIGLVSVRKLVWSNFPLISDESDVAKSTHFQKHATSPFSVLKNNPQPALVKLELWTFLKMGTKSGLSKVLKINNPDQMLFFVKTGVHKKHSFVPPGYRLIWFSPFENVDVVFRNWL